MIGITVNLVDGQSVEIGGISKGSVQEVVEAIKLVYPTWTSLVLTLTRNALRPGGG